MAQALYTQDYLSALQAQRRALEIVFGPVLFQVARIMRKIGLLDLLSRRTVRKGLTLSEICEDLSRSRYSVQVLLESAMSGGLVCRECGTNGDPERYRLTKTGYLLNGDEMTTVLMDFMHDVCYRGLFELEKALDTGEPEGLKAAGDWPSIYEALNSLPSPMRESWFRYDHYFSDCTFDGAFKVVFDPPPRSLVDVGGNTGRWALQCINHDPTVQVTVVDLPQQIALMKETIRGMPGSERITGWETDFLQADASLPSAPDVIWMSQFLDCFNEEQITDILKLAADTMNRETRLYINEVYWDRQRFETAAFVVMQSSPYFTAIANGQSKFLFFPDIERCIEAAGLRAERHRDGLGWGHTLTLCRLA